MQMKHVELTFARATQDGHWIDLLETVGEVSRTHRISVDALSYKGIETALATQPFQKTNGKNIVRFRSMETQAGRPERHLSFSITNPDGQHHLRVEITKETHDKLYGILQDLRKRKQDAEQGVPSNP